MVTQTNYHVFAGDDYYPEGGADDYRSTHDTLEDAERFLADLRPPSSYHAATGWAHISDAQFNVLKRFVFNRRVPGAWAEKTEEDYW